MTSRASLQRRAYAAARRNGLPVVLRAMEVVRLRGLFELSRAALRSEGWGKSNSLGLPVDADGSPIPWYTYGAIHFLAPRMRPEFKVFEFGSGHSTLWYADRVAQVWSVEDDQEWARKVTAMAPSNVNLHIPASDAPAAYVMGIEAVAASPFDLIVIDGQHRALCAEAAIDHLTSGGVIIWDNSERDDFIKTFGTLYEPHGFRSLQFTGIGPILPWVWSTSVLYRPGNCLAI